jgi:nicotinamide mononucleotide adenylyltransferase
MKKYALFIGRFQPMHDGHKFLFLKKIEEGVPVLIAIRDTPVDENNPFTSKQVLDDVTDKMLEYIQLGMCKVIIIPDIEGVYYGRGVGYNVEQIEAPDHIKEISATKIRKQMGL